MYLESGRSSTRDVFCENTKHICIHHKCLIVSWKHFQNGIIHLVRVRSSRPGVFLGKGVLKIWSKFTGEHPCWSAILIKLLCSFIEIALRHVCSPVKLLYFFRTPFSKNISGRLLVYVCKIFQIPKISYPLIYTHTCV